MGLLPAASRTKRLLWALMGGYGLLLHAALMHRQQLWAADTTTSSASISGGGSSSGDSAFTSLVSRALLRKHSDEPQQQQQQQPPGSVQPQYEAQALPVDDEEGSSEAQQPIGEGLAAAAVAAASEEPPITSPASAFWQAEEAWLRGQPDYAAAVSTNSTRPVRTPGEMGRAQECFRKGEGYAYLVHMRKAGGTTMRKYMDDLIVERERGARGRRPRVYVTEGTTFNASCFRDQGELMVVTALRHPISRLLSAYWYEGRYLVHVPPLHPHTDQAIRSALYDKAELAAKVPLSFREWVRRTRVDDYTRWHRMSKRTVWNCVDNYYVRTLTQRYRPNPVAAITEREFHLAKRILSSFDLVLITEHMAWANQTAYARAVLMGVEDDVVAVERRGLEGKGGKGGNLKVRHNKIQKAKNDAEIDPETLQGLWRENHWDVKLYDFAQRLVQERVAAFMDAGRLLPRSDGQACKAPVNDPDFRRDPVPEGQDPLKPFPDSFLFTAPYCENNDYAVEELDERLDFEW